MAEDIRAAVVSRRRARRSYRGAVVIAAAVGTGAFFASPATGESVHPVTGPLFSPSQAASGHGDILSERISGDVSPTSTEILLMRWLLRAHETGLTQQAITTKSLLMRWLITKSTPPPQVTATVAVVEPAPSPAPPPAEPAPPPAQPAPPPAPRPAPPSPVSAPAANGYGCAAAEAYLSTHAAPGYVVVCPGNADGHYAMTCDNVPSLCPGEKVIVIAVPCPVAYMNEASNSLVISGMSTAPIDPYGEGCDP